jgi:hypothetical protein
MKSFRKLALDATLLGTVALALLLPAFAQQEMDPTWYDPWAKPAAHVTKVAATDAGKPRQIKVASQDRPKNKKAGDGKVSQPQGTERAALVRK